MLLPRCYGLLIAALMVLSMTGCSKDNNPLDIDQQPASGSTTVDFPDGGEIELPAGALPDGATVSAQTASAPPLPPGVDLAGDAVRVDVTGGVLQRPAVVRLPVPAQKMDEGTLVVFQVEDDGTQLMLGGEIDGEQIVAYSPGFGQSSMLDDLRARMKTMSSTGGRLVAGVVLPGVDDLGLPELSPPKWAPITGPGFVAVGGVANYVMNLRCDEELISWTHVPGSHAEAVTPALDSPHYYAIRGLEPGLVDLMIDYVGHYSGIRGFSSRTVSVQSEIEVVEDALFVGVTPTEPIVGGNCRLSGTTVGSPVLVWDWDFGEGTTGTLTTTPGSLRESFINVNHVYESVGTYTATMTATFQSGGAVTSTGTFRVTDEKMRIVLDGPDRFVPTSSGETKEYSALIIGGEPDYDVTWRLYPGVQVGETEASGIFSTEYAFSFPEPGTYYLSVDVTDAEGATAHITRLVTVKKVTDLDAQIEVVPIGKRAPAESYTSTISIEGGILVVNGEKKGYAVEMHWGDGDTESRTVDSPSGPPEGSVQFSHTYNENGSYEAYAVVSDGVGDEVDTDVVTIEIDTEPALSFTDCRVTIRVIGDIETTVNGEDSTTTSARRYLSNWAEGGFSGNTFTGSYEEEIFGKTGSIEITLNDAGDLVESYHWTEESETTGGVIVTTVSGTNVPLYGNPNAGNYKLVGETACGAVSTLQNYSTGTAPFTLTEHRCNSQSSVEISFMER